jgi:hypothetical protein
MNLIIEYDGIQHFEPVDFAGNGKDWAERRFFYTKICDELKTKYCKEKDIKLIRIPYTEFKNIKTILFSELFS